MKNVTERKLIKSGRYAYNKSIAAIIKSPGMPFTDEIRKPVNFISILLALLSVLPSIIFYYNSQKKKEISYLLSESTSLIFDSKNSSSAIKLFEKDSILIEGNVYLLTGTIWNSGNLPISKEDIRLPLQIILDKSTKILDFKITKQYDSSISNFTLSNNLKNTLKINWRYFDPAFGFRFQIIYVGKNDPNFLLEGKILGIKQFVNLQTQGKPTGFAKWFLLVIAPAVQILMFIVLIYFKIRNGVTPKDLLLPFLLLFTMLILSYWLFFIRELRSPI